MRIAHFAHKAFDFFLMGAIIEDKKIVSVIQNHSSHSSSDINTTQCTISNSTIAILYCSKTKGPILRQLY